MKQIGRKIYYDKATGNIIIEKGEMEGGVIETTAEQDIAAYTELSERNRETFDVIELSYGQYAQDFAECNGYRVNTETKSIEFSYSNLDAPTEEPVYQKPLSEEVKTLKEQLTITQEALDFLIMGGM